jgi:hypothetical protein
VKPVPVQVASVAPVAHAPVALVQQAPVHGLGEQTLDRPW